MIDQNRLRQDKIFINHINAQLSQKILILTISMRTQFIKIKIFILCNNTSQDSILYLIFIRVNMYFIFSIISLSCISISVSSGFHLDQAIQSAYFSNEIKSITALANNTLAIAKGQLTNATITILQGSDFSHKINQVTLSGVKNLPLITSSGIFVNTGKNIQIRQTVETNATIVNQKITRSNLLLIQNPSRVVASQKQQCPTLLQIILSNREASQKTYEQSQPCQFQSIGYVDQLGNSSLAYAAGYNIYIVSKQTLSLQQKLAHLNKEKFKPYGYIDSYTSNNATTLITSTDENLTSQTDSKYVLYSNNNEDKKFQQVNLIFNPTSPIRLNDLDSGVSFLDDNLYRWHDLATNNVVSVDFVTWDQFLEQMYVVSVFYSEQHIILGNKSTNQVWVCQYHHTNHSISKQKGFNLSEGHINSHSGVMSTNDSYMMGIISSQKQGQKSNKIVKYNVANNSYQILAEDVDNTTNSTRQANCSAFVIIDDKQYITICTSDIPNQEQDSTYSAIIYEQIQLRMLGDDKVLDRLPIPNIQLHPIKVLYNIQWDGIFALQVKLSFLPNEDQCQTIFFVIENEKIIKLEQNLSTLSFAQSWAAGRYIASMKIIANGPITQNDKYLKIYRVERQKNMTQVKKILYTSAYKENSYNFYSQKNVLLIQQKQKPYHTDVYYFTRYDVDDYKGAFFRQFYPTGSEKNMDYFIMGEHSLLYMFCTLDVSNVRPIKAVYDINTTSIWQAVKLLPNNNNSVNDQLIAYIAGEQGASTIYIIASNKLYKIIGKKYYNITQQIQLYPLTKQIQYYSLKICSDNKYIVMLFQDTKQGRYYTEIRSLANLKYQQWIYATTQYIYNADLSKNGQVVLNTDQDIKMVKFQPTAYSQQYNIEQFQLFDTNNMGCVVLSGRVKNATNTTRILYKKSIYNEDYLFTNVQESIQIIALDIKCTYMATYSDDTLSIWEISQVNKKLTKIQSSNQKNVSSIKFGEGKIIIEADNQIIIRDIISNISQKEIDRYVHSNRFVVSPDGSFYAEYDSQVWVVYISRVADQQQIALFKPGKNITGMSFTPDNYLYISTYNQSFYTLAPTPCPATYMNIQSICTCRTNTTEINNLCECNKNFQRQGEECICGEQFEFVGGLCQCPANTTQKLATCQCNQNFIKKQNVCVCPEEFEYVNNLCSCRENSTLKEGKCLCKQNFIQQNLNCKCPLSFDFYDDECVCKNGYISEEKICSPCSFPCKQCSQSGSNCSNYRASFYALIVISCVVFLLVSVLIGYCICKKKKSKTSIDQMLEEHDLSKYNLFVQTEKKS